MNNPLLYLWAGLLQCTSSEPLKILNDFANKKINLRDANNLESAEKMRVSLPSFWPIITSILKLEDDDFLPDIVCQIVKVLIFIRRKTFQLAPARYKEDFFEYKEDKENSTSFFPNHPIKKYASRYNISGRADEDHCTKTFPSHHDFIDGIFSIGTILYAQ